MKVDKRILAGLLIIIIPFVSIGLAANILTRLPDLYAYEFTKSKVTEEIRLSAKPAEIGQLFSGYLAGKVLELQLVAEYQGRTKQIFTMKDQIGMHNVRKLIDSLLLMTVLSILVGFLLTYRLIRKNEKELVRTAYKYSAALFLIFWISILITPIGEFLGSYIQKLIFDIGFEADSLLGILLSSSFFQTWFVFNFIAAAIILFILGLIIWKFTRERRMFVY